jgi:solute carrier family 35 protein C2
MGEDTHRRRSASIVHAAGGKHTGGSSRAKHGYRQSSISLGPNGTTDSSTAVIHEDSAPSSSDVEMNDMRSDDDEMTDDEETGLTQAERRKRRRRKRRSTMLDERVAGNNGHGNAGDLKRTEEELANANLVSMYGVNAVLIALWYTFSISISVYNKWMFSKENLDFHFPLFTTSLHMVVQFTCASAVLFFFPNLRPGAGSVDPHAQGYAQVEGDEDGTERRSSPPPPIESKGPLMTRWFYLTRIGPCGTATALDIGLGNFSLRFISLTFFTMCKSSVLAFVLLFAFIFRLEKPSWRLGGIISLMSVGVVMMVAGETAFNALGFILVMTASFCSGFRWSLTQILLLRNPATSNPFSSIFFLTPVMFLALFVLALPIEGTSNLIEGLHILAETKGIFLGTLIMLFPGALAFLMVAAEFALLKRTSVVTLSVCGIFKEVLTISAAGAVFGDELSPINVSGLVVTIASIAAYNYLKYLKMRSDAQKQAHEFLEDVADEETGESAKAGDRLSYDDTIEPEEPRRHRQTSALMRHSLSLAIGEHPQHGAGQSSSQSPVKRPENLE